jgi:hypothetical protein
MATGEDGSLWCTDPATCAIWRIEPDGHCTRFPLGEGIRPAQLLGGRNGTLVFTVEGRSWLGSIRVLPGPGVPADAALKAHPEAKGTRSATPERGEAQPEPAPATGQGMDLQVPRQVLERILAQNGHGAASPGQGQFAPRYGTPAQIEALLDRSLARRNLERWPNPQVKRHYFTYCRVPGVGRVPKGDTWVDTDNFVVVTKKNHRQATGLPYHTVTAAYPVLGDRPPWVPRHLDLPPEEEVLAPQQPRAPAHPVSKAQVRMEAMGFRLEHKNVRKIKRKYGHGTEADPQFAERYRFVEDYRALFAAGLAGPVLGPWEPPGEEGRWVHLCKVEGAGQHREEGAWKPIDAFAVITQPAPGGTGREVVQVFPVVPASLPELVPPAWGQQLQAWRAQPAAKPPETLAAPPDFGPLAWPPPQPALLQETKAPTGASGSRKPREFHARSAAQAGASAEDTATPRLETKASAPAPRTARPTLWEAWKALKARKLRLGKEAYAHIAQRHGFGSDQTECQFDEPYLSMDMFKRLLGEALASTRIGWWPTRDDDTTWLTFCRMEGSGWVFWDEAWHPCDHFVVVTRPGQSRGETLHQVVTAFPMTPDQILERTPAEAQAAVKAWLENPDLPPPFPAESPGAATTGSAGP